MLYFGQHLSRLKLALHSPDECSQFIKIDDICEDKNICQSHFGWGIASFITDSGNVYSLNVSEENCQRPVKIEFPEKKRKCITCCAHPRDSILLLILEDSNSCCYLYNGNRNCSEKLIKILIPSMQSTKLIKASIAINFALVLSNDGSLFHFELDNLTTIKLVSFPSIVEEIPPAKTFITRVVCGYEHYLALNNVGTIFSSGSSRRGQLGHGTPETQTIPKVVEGLEGICVSKISAGGWHSAAITSIGDLYVWGWNENNQLGLNLTNQKEGAKISFSPELIDFPEEVNFLDVACGTRHTVVLTSEGCVWVWGWNGYGQLGGTSQPITKTLLLYNILPPEYALYRPIAINASHWSTMIHFDQEII